LKIKNYKFEIVENFVYLGVIFNEDNNNEMYLQERIKNANKTCFMPQKFFKNKNISKKLKLRLIEHNNKQSANIYIRNLDTNKERDRKQLNVLKGKYIEEF